MMYGLLPGICRRKYLIQHPFFFSQQTCRENDYLAKTISHKLYDANPETKIAAAILLGEGGC